MPFRLSRILLPVFLLSCSALYGQRVVNNDIEISFLDPIGFLAPGVWQHLYLRVFNPPDSGLVLNDISNWEHDRLQLPGSLSIPPYRAPCLFTINYLGTIKPCVSIGEFPLHPGESLILNVGNLTNPPGSPIGTKLGFNNFYLEFETDSGLTSSYSKNMVLYIVSEDGTGDPSVFDEFDIFLPLKIPPKLEATYFLSLKYSRRKPFQSWCVIEKCWRIAHSKYQAALAISA